MKVKDCMCNNVCCIKPNTKISDIAKIMNEKHIGCVPVCDDNNCICGIITDRDILLRTVACDKDCCNTIASDIMTTNICTCKEDDEITNAESKMCNYQIRRLPVCDENNHVVGILTLGDLIQNENQSGNSNITETLRDICNCNTENNNA